MFSGTRQESKGLPQHGQNLAIYSLADRERAGTYILKYRKLSLEQQRQMPCLLASTWWSKLLSLRRWRSLPNPQNYPSSPDSLPPGSLPLAHPGVWSPPPLGCIASPSNPTHASLEAPSSSQAPRLQTVRRRWRVVLGDSAPCQSPQEAFLDVS